VELDWVGLVNWGLIGLGWLTGRGGEFSLKKLKKYLGLDAYYSSHYLLKRRNINCPSIRTNQSMIWGENYLLIFLWPLGVQK